MPQAQGAKNMIGPPVPAADCPGDSSSSTTVAFPACTFNSDSEEAIIPGHGTPEWPLVLSANAVLVCHLRGAAQRALLPRKGSLRTRRSGCTVLRGNQQQSHRAKHPPSGPVLLLLGLRSSCVLGS